MSKEKENINEDNLLPWLISRLKQEKSEKIETTNEESKELNHSLFKRELLFEAIQEMI